MTGLFLDHPLFFSGALFVLLVIAVESGFRIAVLSAANLDEDRREQIAASRDSLGILLSLLLGFTLAMALPRFDLRKQLVVDEANAIGTTSLRAGILPEPQRKAPHRARKPHPSNDLVDAPPHCLFNLSNIRVWTTAPLLADHGHLASD